MIRGQEHRFIIPATYKVIKNYENKYSGVSSTFKKLKIKKVKVKLTAIWKRKKNIKKEKRRRRITLTFFSSLEHF